MTETMNTITVSLVETTYSAVAMRAKRQGYRSVEEYVRDLIEDDDDPEFQMTAELSTALDAGLADIKEGRVISFEELKRRQTELQNDWVRVHES